MKKITTAQKQREILAKNLNDLLHMKRRTQADVIRETGLAEATVRSWFSGEKYPRLEGLQTLAEYFNVPRSRLTEEQIEGMQRVTALVKIPVLGTIACGEPIMAEENYEDYREEIADMLPTGKKPSKKRKKRLRINLPAQKPKNRSLRKKTLWLS